MRENSRHQDHFSNFLIVLKNGNIETEKIERRKMSQISKNRGGHFQTVNNFHRFNINPMKKGNFPVNF